MLRLSKPVMLRKGGWEMEKPEKPEKLEKAEKRTEEKKRVKPLAHTAEEKCRAVLSVWTEKRKPGEVCREMGVEWVQLNSWQERAMEGMLLALQPVPVQRVVALNKRLAVLLERKSRKVAMNGLEQRLARLQGSPPKPGDLLGGEKKA